MQGIKHTKADLEEKKVSELQPVAISMGIDVAGVKKADLIDKILTTQSQRNNNGSKTKRGSSENGKQENGKQNSKQNNEEQEELITKKGIGEFLTYITSLSYSSSKNPTCRSWPSASPGSRSNTL